MTGRGSHPVVFSLAALLLAAPGCSPLDLGEAPFFCNAGKPHCPVGYVCVNNTCRREGSALGDGGLRKDGPPVKKDGTPQQKDGPVKKDGPQQKKDGPVKMDGPVKKDGPVKQDGPVKKDGPVKQDGPTGPVKVVINEFMADPAASLDSKGEWLELYNLGPAPVDVNGWTLKDKDSDSHKISHSGPLWVPSNGFLILGRSTDKSKNGGAPVAYAWSNFVLANTNGDEVQLYDKTMTHVDSFSYPKTFKIPTGASLALKTPGANKDLASSWCTETKAWGGSQGDKGSPLGQTGCGP